MLSKLRKISVKKQEYLPYGKSTYVTVMEGRGTGKVKVGSEVMVFFEEAGGGLGRWKTSCVTEILDEHFVSGGYGNDGSEIITFRTKNNKYILEVE